MEYNKRLLSLDVLRGFDMFWIMGAGVVVTALAQLLEMPALAAQMGHVAWNGFRFFDLIFPLFLFIAGISFPFSAAKNRDGIYGKIAKRALLLVVFGLIYNGLFAFDWSGVRIFSVLGRIGLAWALGAVIYLNTGRVGRLWISVSILLAYWLLLRFCVAPDAPVGTDGLSYEGNLVGYVDRLLFAGHLHVPHVFDPEGLLSLIPAVVTALLGMWAGDVVRSDKKPMRTMLLVGVGLLVLALLWNEVMPINKNLWSSSFVCLTGGIGFLLFAFFYWVIDVKGWRSWTFFFQVIGVNSITIYMLQCMVDVGYTSHFLVGGVAGLLPGAWATLVEALAYTAVSWLVLWALYRYKIFLKV